MSREILPQKPLMTRRQMLATVVGAGITGALIGFEPSIARFFEGPSDEELRNQIFGDAAKLAGKVNDLVAGGLNPGIGPYRKNEVIANAARQNPDGTYSRYEAIASYGRYVGQNDLSELPDPHKVYPLNVSVLTDVFSDIKDFQGIDSEGGRNTTLKQFMFRRDDHEPDEWWLYNTLRFDDQQGYTTKKMPATATAIHPITPMMLSQTFKDMANIMDIMAQPDMITSTKMTG